MNPFIATNCGVPIAEGVHCVPSEQAVCISVQLQVTEATAYTASSPQNETFGISTILHSHPGSTMSLFV